MQRCLFLNLRMKACTRYSEPAHSSARRETVSHFLIRSFSKVYWRNLVSLWLMVYWWVHLITHTFIYWLSCWLNECLPICYSDKQWMDWLVYWGIDSLNCSLLDWLSSWLNEKIIDLFDRIIYLMITMTFWFVVFFIYSLSYLLNYWMIKLVDWLNQLIHSHIDRSTDSLNRKIVHYWFPSSLSRDIKSC